MLIAGAASLKSTEQYWCASGTTPQSWVKSESI